jgi:glycosyltransferase involved in cell wall biosynthesis
MKTNGDVAEQTSIVNGFGSHGVLSERLRDFKPQWTRRRRSRGKSRNILHLLSQQPGKTGSGVALLALVRHSAEAGWRQRALIGLPASEPQPDIPPLTPADVFAVRFDQEPVPFAIPGMSDIMPYVSTRFSSFTGEMLEAYLHVFAAALSAAATGFQPDIILSNHLWLLTALARVLFPQIPLCVYSHGTELRQLNNAAQLTPFVIPGCSAADVVCALHEDNKRRIMKAYGIPAERIRIVGAGFRDDLFKPDTACEPAGGREELVIVYAGKISTPKGVPWLIEAMRRVNAPEGKRVKLLLAGSSGDAGAEAIRKQAADLENVVFLGALSQPNLAAVLQTADIFVLPSFFEGLPLVVIESLACGCRVVMTDLPGLDSWMPAGLCDEGLVERVRLPRLVGPDMPIGEDLPRFVEALTEALNRQLARSVACGRASGADCRLAPMSWEGVFGRIRAACQELAES